MFPENGGQVGTYYYLFPTYAQGKKILWDGIDRSGFKFLDHFPKELIAGKPNETEMQVVLINGSVFQIVGTDKMDSIVGTNPIGCVFSEYALQNPRGWDLIRPILRENGGWAVFPYTPRGKNHGKVLYDMARDNPDWFCELRTVRDTGVLTDDDIDADRREGMNEELIQQEYYCSFEGYQEGSYYAKQLRDAYSSGRIGQVPYEPTTPVFTFWDLGIGDAMAVWFAQRVGQSLRFIDYYETTGEGMGYFAKLLKDKPYTYARHYMPHDAGYKEIGSGISRRETAERLGIKPIDVVPRTRDILEDIENCRRLLTKCWIDQSKCQQGINALESYRKEWDDERREFKAKPYHDWSSHGADAFRTAACSDFESVPVGYGDTLRVAAAFDVRQEVKDMRIDNNWDVRFLR